MSEPAKKTTAILPQFAITLCHQHSQIFPPSHANLIGALKTHVVVRLATCCIALIFHATAVTLIGYTILAWIGKIFGGIDPQVVNTLRQQTINTFSLSLRAMWNILHGQPLNQVFAKLFPPPKPNVSTQTPRMNLVNLMACIFKGIRTPLNPNMNHARVQHLSERIKVKQQFASSLEKIHHCQPSEEKHIGNFTVATCKYYLDPDHPIEYITEELCFKMENTKHRAAIFAIFEPNKKSAAASYLKNGWQNVLKDELESLNSLSQQQVEDTLKNVFVKLNNNFIKNHPSDSGCKITFTFIWNEILFVLLAGNTETVLENDAEAVPVKQGKKSCDFGLANFEAKHLSVKTKSDIITGSHLYVGSSHLFQYLKSTEIARYISENKIGSNVSELVDNLTHKSSPATQNPQSALAILVRFQTGPSREELPENINYLLRPVGNEPSLPSNPEEEKVDASDQRSTTETPRPFSETDSGILVELNEPTSKGNTPRSEQESYLMIHANTLDTIMMTPNPTPPVSARGPGAGGQRYSSNTPGRKDSGNDWDDDDWTRTSQTSEREGQPESGLSTPQLVEQDNMEETTED